MHRSSSLCDEPQSAGIAYSENLQEVVANMREGLVPPVMSLKEGFQ